MRKPIHFKDAQQTTKEAMGKILASGCRPSKTNRDSMPRTDSKSNALARAVYASVKLASEDGTLVKQKTGKGYVMTWTKSTSD